MARTAHKQIMDGAVLSPKLKAKPGEQGISLPIGKSEGSGGVAVARAYKHAAGKSSTYSPQVVDMIYHMSREGHLPDDQVRTFVEAKLAAERDLPRTPPPATWDQLVFLSANLTRLVIDPYREKCNSRVVIGAEREQPLTLDWPVVLGGIDLARAPRQVAAAWGKAAADAKLAVIAGPTVLLPAGARRILLLDIASPLPDSIDAAAILLTAPRASDLTRTQVETVLRELRSRTGSRLPIGVVTPAFNARAVVDQTIELQVDFYAPHAQWTQNVPSSAVFPELEAGPAIHVLADTVEQLRKHNCESTIAVLNVGGIRGGADAGKAICIGATAVALGVSAVVGMGFKVTAIDGEADLLAQSAEAIDPAEAAHSVHNFAKSVNMEVTMLARACGKSSVTNMEPEDLRSLTIAVSAATGVPVTGKDHNFRF